MPRRGKKYREAAAKVERKAYPLEEAIKLVKETSYANFDETVEVSMKLGVNPRHADQMVRGTVVLPHGTGKSRKVLVVTEGPAAKEAEEAGADWVMGAEEAVKKIQDGWLEFDAVVATPDMMRYLSRVDKSANVHAPVGKVSFPDDKLVENTKAFVEAVMKAKPQSAKGRYVHSIHVSATMGPGIKVDPASVEAR